MGSARETRVFETTWGFCAVSTRGKGLWASSFPEQTPEAAQAALSDGSLRRALSCPQDEVPAQADLLDRAAEALQAYFQGALALPDLPLDLDECTPFARKVLHACARIAPGELRTYGELAAAVGSPGASRAVGQAMARNRLPILVPCHRVIGTSGRLTGFGGGMALKARLIEFEGQKVECNAAGNWRVVK